MSDMVAIITAGAAALGTLGGAGKYIWDKVEKRFTAIEAELKSCRENETTSQERRSLLLRAHELVCHELATLFPGAWSLTRAAELLQEAKKLDEKP